MNSIIRHINGDNISSIQIYSHGIQIFDKANNEQTLITGKKVRPIESVDLLGHDEIPSLVEVNFKYSNKQFYGRDLTVVIVENEED